MKLNVLALALASGLLWGVGLFLLTWYLIFVEGAAPDDKLLLGRFYLGYRVTPMGSLIGLAWALPDGFIGGAIFAWVYNALAKRR